MLMSSKFIPVGRLVGGDCKKLHAYGVTITCWIELRGLCLEAVSTLDSTGLKALAEHFLHDTLDKHGQTGDYTQIPLPEDLR